MYVFFVYAEGRIWSSNFCFYFISILFVTVIQRKTNNMKYGLSAIRKPLLVKIQ